MCIFPSCCYVEVHSPHENGTFKFAAISSRGSVIALIDFDNYMKQCSIFTDVNQHKSIRRKVLTSGRQQT